MNTTLSLSAYSELPPHLANADPAQQIWLPLDMLAAESPSLAKWRGLAVDGRVIPSYVFIGPRGGSVPIRLALLGGIQSEDLLSINAIVKLLVDLDLAPLLAQDFALFSITLLSIYLPTGGCFCKIAGHGVEWQAMAPKY